MSAGELRWEFSSLQDQGHPSAVRVMTHLFQVLSQLVQQVFHALCFKSLSAGGGNHLAIKDVLLTVIS